MTNKLSFFVGKSSFLGIGYYLLFSLTKQNAWICIILGTILGIPIIYLINKLKNLDESNLINKIVLSVFYSYMILIFITLLPLFVNSFYLVSTPSIFITTPFFLTALYIAHKGPDVLAKLSNILFVLSITLSIITALFLFKYFEFSSFLPILNTSKLSIIKGTILYTSISAIPFILTKDYTNLKDNIKNYLILSITLLIICICTIGVLGEILISTYSFPEYIVLKRINFLGFIQNIENILSCIWYFDLMIILAASSLNLKNTINNKYIYYISVSILLLISILFFGHNYIFINSFFKSYSIILILFLLLFSGLLFITKKTKSHRT